MTFPTTESLDRHRLTSINPLWTHRGRSVGQADVCGYEGEGGKRFVVKDFARRPWLVRRLWGRWILRREWKRLERLQGVAGIPRLLGWVDAEAFAMEWIEGERLPHEKDSGPGPEFFDRLEKLVAEMHARGVSHGDLRRKNILVDREQRPYLIDFATAYLVRPQGREPSPRRNGSRRVGGRRLFERLCEIDRLTVLKLKCYYCLESVTDEERRRLEQQPLALRAGRFLRKKVYRPFKPKHLRRGWVRLREWVFGGSPEE